MLPIGRWKGYGGDTDLHGETLETITWATGLLAATERITVFGTVHAPLFHPIIAAKQIVTADHVGAGPLRPQHRRRLERGRVRDVRRRSSASTRRATPTPRSGSTPSRWRWGPSDDFDFDGEHIKLKKVRAKPKPYGGTRPLIMNAGSSGAGQAFALRNCDAFFTATSTSRQGVDATAEDGRRTSRPRRAASAARSRCSSSARWSAARPRRRPRTTTTTPSSTCRLGLGRRA